MKQKTKVNNSYKDWLEFVFGVLQGSILSFLGVKFDNRQIFDEQILDLCKEASWKIHALAHERTQVTYTYELTLSLKYSLIIAR